MGSKKHTAADAVLHNMIERIYFYLFMFSQKEMGSQETHGRRGCSWQRTQQLIFPALGSFEVQII
jgi:hypothetical protein